MTSKEQDQLQRAFDLACQDLAKVSGSAKLFKQHFLARVAVELENTRATK